jgi:hypothetical protein
MTTMRMFAPAAPVPIAGFFFGVTADAFTVPQRTTAAVAAIRQRPRRSLQQ